MERSERLGDWGFESLLYWNGGLGDKTRVLTANDTSSVEYVGARGLPPRRRPLPSHTAIAPTRSAPARRVAYPVCTLSGATLPKPSMLLLGL